jgi:hypothetical protein
MSSAESYRAALADLPAADWEPYPLALANLPGPRGNLELAQAVADVGSGAQFRQWAGLGPDVAPENTLKQPEHAAAVLRILDEITASIAPALAGLRPSQGEKNRLAKRDAAWVARWM